MLAGLVLAVPLVVLSSRAELGLAALARGWFLIPEEVAPPAELKWLYQDAAVAAARAGPPRGRPAGVAARRSPHVLTPR